MLQECCKSKDKHHQDLAGIAARATSSISLTCLLAKIEVKEYPQTADSHCLLTDTEAACVP